MKATKLNLRISTAISLLCFLLLSGIAQAQVSKNVWMYIYNSDGSAPADGDIKIRAWLQKNPSNVIVSSNIANGWIYDINNRWGFFPNPEDASATNATVGDVIVIDCENVSGGQFNGEHKRLTGTLNGDMWQQFGGNNFSLPVELSSFNAVVDQGIVNLNWMTESETINLGFNIYRCEEGSNSYDKVNGKIIPGAGTSNEKHYYSFSDDNVEYGKTYSYKIQNLDSDGKNKFYAPLSVTVDTRQVPSNYELSQNYPNPFNPTTTISYSILDDRHVTLTIYNTLGKVVKTLVNDHQAAGKYNMTWDGTSNNGMLVSSGTYFYQIKAGDFTQVKKMMFTK